MLPILLHAQEQLTGTVSDHTYRPLDGVTIIVSQHNVNLISVLADSGKFEINKQLKGSYTITATLIGYKTYTRVANLPKDTIKIIMQEDNKVLAEVKITVNKPLIERKIDRVVFNVENSIVSNGGSAWDAVAKAPGIQINADGSIKANKKSATVYVDDKPVKLASDDLSSYLQSLPSDGVSKIEVITNPPAKYDAEGGAIINIITKKSLAQGLNVTLHGGFTAATSDSYRASTQFNYRKGKLNVYGNYGYSNSDKKYFENDYITYETPASSSFWNSNKNMQNKSNSSTYKLGADYQLNSKQMIGFLVTGYNRDGHSNSGTGTTITNNKNGTIDSLLQTTIRSTTQASQQTYNLNYNIKLDTSGKSLDFNIDYSPYRNQNNQFLDNYSTLSNGGEAVSQYHIFTPATQNINIYSGKLDYASKLSKTWNLTSGLKYSSVQTENDFNYFNNAGNNQEADDSRSDHFKYIENTAAAYASFSGVVGKWTLNGGLRAEYTSSKGISEILDSVTKRQYFKLFPTAYILYQLNEQNELQLTYSYRIQRPEYFRLNPTKSYVNPYSFVIGNPLLQPSFIHSIELSYTNNKKYTISGFYDVTHDMFTYITEQDNVNNLLLTTQKNLGLSSNAGIRLSVSFQAANWWDINAAADGSYQTEKSAYLQGSYDYHKFNWNASLDQTFTINKIGGLKAELNTLYHGPQISGILAIARTYDVSTGIRKTIFNGQGTIRLTASDIFYGNPFRVESHYLTQNNGIYMKQDTRNVTLGLTYKLGKNINASRTRSTSSEEEKQRAQ